MNSMFGRVARAEWTKLRSVPSTAWSVLALIGLTVLLSFFVSASVGITGGVPGCTPGAPGCGDEDVVMNALTGVLFGQFAVVAIATLAATGEYATGTIRSTLTSVPRRSAVLAAKASVVGVLCLAAGLVASLAAFLTSQPVLHGNGFVPAQGYPIMSLADEPALRAVIGSGLYLALVGLLSLGVGMIVRHTAAAITVMFALLLVPFIAALLLPEHPRELVQRYSPMTAGMAIQRTVERVDCVPIGVWAGLGVLAAWAVAALVGASVMINRRDA
jgi:ABC-2 type transport system permease protein